MARSDSHEDFQRTEDVRMPAERSFGLVFAVVFLIIGLVPILWPPHSEPRIWALIIAAAFLFSAFFWTPPLRPLNRLWFRFGLLLHAVMNPVVMGFLFYAVVTPIGLTMRAFGKDFLRLRPTPNAATYWIARDSGIAPDSMKNQF